jgi:hypothetical protein
MNTFSKGVKIIRSQKIFKSETFANQLFSTDTDHTWPQLQSNRWSRSRTSCECSTTKQSNTSRSGLIIIQLFMWYFAQTLTTLDLSYNEIGAQGAEHLANALQQNKVTRFAQALLLFNSSCTIFHRHWPHFTSVTIKSVIKEQNILRMLYNKTK